MATTMHISDIAEVLGEGRTHYNLSPGLLVEQSILRGEAKLAANGSLVGYTNRTGRSPKDKFIVKDEITAGKVAWGAVNAPIEPEKFDALYERVMEHLRGRELFVQDLFCGADPIAPVVTIGKAPSGKADHWWFDLSHFVDQFFANAIDIRHL